MIRATLMSLAFLAGSPASAPAQALVEDAFGIVPEDALSASRAAWSGLRTGAGRDETLPPEAVQTVLIFAGAKSLVAGKDVGHAVALALDPHGNLASDGIGVTFTTGSERHAPVPLLNGRADVLFKPGTRAGTFVAGAATDTVQSARALFRVTTHLDSVRPSTARHADPLVPETFATFATTPLRDRYGNEVEDGIALGFVLAHADGSASLMTGLSRDGQAEARMLTRDVETGGGLSAVLAANAAPDQQITFARLEPGAPVGIVAWPVPELDAASVRVGPMTTSAGHLLTDGAPVSITVETGAGESHSRAGWVRDGHFEALLPLSPGTAPLRVTVDSPLGRETHDIALTTAPETVRGAE